MCVDAENKIENMNTLSYIYQNLLVEPFVGVPHVLISRPW